MMRRADTAVVEQGEPEVRARITFSAATTLKSVCPKDDLKNRTTCFVHS